MRIAVLLLVVFGSSSAVAQSSCIAGASTACLQSDRFQVEVAYDTNGSAFVAPEAGTPTGSAQIVAQGGFPTDSAAPFSFYDADQIDLIVRVVNGCAINDRFWVFTSAATDAGATVTVTDTATGEVVQYANPAGQAFAPVFDTEAFQTCGAAPASGSTTTTMSTEPRGTCGATFCLQGGRYALDVSYTTNGGISGTATSALATDHSGVGSFFGQSDGSESLTTVIDGRADNQAFWFLASAGTDGEVTYTLTDTTTALTNTYVDPPPGARTLLDRGQPVAAAMSGPASIVQPGQAITFRLTLTNSAPAERIFTATIPTPPGASSPQFVCTAQNGAICPNASGSGPFSETGPIAAGGQLIYDYTVTADAARGAVGSLAAEATVVTAAHALAGEGSVVTSAGTSVVEPVAVPIGAGWALVMLMLGLSITVVRLYR